MSGREGWEWRCAVVRFGGSAGVTSRLAHLVNPEGGTACGMRLPRSVPERPELRAAHRCDRCTLTRRR